MAALKEMIDDLELGESVVITRNGVPIAELIPYDPLLSNPKFAIELERSQQAVHAGQYSTLEEFNERHGYQPTPRHNRQNPQKPKRKR